MSFHPRSMHPMKSKQKLSIGTPYRIQPGDTFAGLAESFGYTLDALLSNNPGIDPGHLPVGQQICLPPAPGGGPFPYPGGSMYILQPGDSLYTVAQRFGCPLSLLITANPQLPNPDDIEVDTLIFLPHEPFHEPGQIVSAHFDSTSAS